MYENNTKKTIIVVNEKIGTAQLFNATGHLIIGLAVQVGVEQLNMLEYPFQDELKHSFISEYPVIVLKTNNSNQLAKLRQSIEMIDTPIIYNCFTGEMIGENANAQISANLNSKQPDFWAIAMFGDSEALAPLTKRFSLYK